MASPARNAVAGILLAVAVLAGSAAVSLGLAAVVCRPAPVASCVLVYNDFGHGSGAIIEPNAVLTARHVAEQPDLVIRTHDGDEHPVVRTVLDPDSDLAVVYIEGTFDERPLPVNRIPLYVGEEITLIGSPYDKALMNCVLRGRVVKVDAADVNMDILDCHAAPGTSGGPVLDLGGRIRAVLVSGYNNLCGAIPVEELDVD